MRRYQKGQKIPVEIQPFAAALLDPRSLHCVDCGGFPLGDGAAFVAVFVIRHDVATIGGICELCWLKRLERRGRIVNATSSPSSQVEVPGLGLFKKARAYP